MSFCFFFGGLDCGFWVSRLELMVSEVVMIDGKIFKLVVLRVFFFWWLVWVYWIDLIIWLFCSWVVEFWFCWCLLWFWWCFYRVGMLCGWDLVCSEWLCLYCGCCIVLLRYELSSWSFFFSFWWICVWFCGEVLLGFFDGVFVFWWKCF